MAIKKNYFISDMHIGSNESTDWYQNNIHDPCLITILNYITVNKDLVQESILLGDMVDQWMYTSDKQSPDFKTITERNSGIFGPQGTLMQTLDSLQGRIAYNRKVI